MAASDIINVLNRQTPGAYNPRYETATLEVS